MLLNGGAMRTSTLSISLLASLGLAHVAHADAPASSSPPAYTPPASPAAAYATAQPSPAAPAPYAAPPVAPAGAVDGAPAPTPTRRERVLSLGLMQASNDDSARAGLTFDVSERLKGGPMYVHGAIVLGSMAIPSLSAEREGFFSQVRLGLEGRTDGDFVRVLGGIDLAYQRDSIQRDPDGYSTMAIPHSELVGIPRVGVEVGARLRARLVAELPSLMQDYGIDVGFGLALAAGAAF
jgi:hypothetical protein